MFETYALAGAILGLSLALSHAVQALRKRQEPSLERAIELLVSGVAVGTGVRLMVVCFTAEHLSYPFEAEDRWLIAVGGFAVVWVSLLRITKELRKTSRPQPLAGSGRGKGPVDTGPVPELPAPADDPRRKRFSRKPK